MRPLGRHLIMDAWECNEEINSVEAIAEALCEAVSRSRATLIELFVHPFTPHGVSGVAVIAESHIAVHTWPEKSYLSLDVFTCGERAMPEAVIEVFKERFRPGRCHLIEIPRGQWPATAQNSFAVSHSARNSLQHACDS